ncbi:MAG: hypothetical protein EOO73_31860 [Myxococcales bacterium]|nr:MAG: hypothetical protein EOO73_31860 [Myxococcales bacterium]
MRWAALGAWGAVAILACGSGTPAEPPSGGAGAAGTGTGGSGSAGTGAAPPIAISDLCPLFTRDLCVYLMQCQGARYENAAHCERELTCFGLPQLTAAAERGAVDYDPRQVGVCHARFEASPCTFAEFIFTPDIYDVLQYCPGAVKPKLRVGEACSSSGECTEGSYCYQGGKAQCPGECLAPASEGQSCTEGKRCAEGLSCDGVACAPQQQPGSPCEFGCEYGLSCPRGEICPGNLWCNEVGQCETGRLEGEPCGPTGSGAQGSLAQCAIHLWCDDPNGEGKCRKQSPEGGACRAGAAYACTDGLHCVGAGSGAAATLGTCQPPGPAGQDCGEDEDCQSGLACISEKCAALGAQGAPCGGDDDCAPGLVCFEQKCATARYPGDACDGTRCTFSRCVNGSCEYHARVGEPCAVKSDCATSQCVGGLCYDDSVCRAPE